MMRWRKRGKSGGKKKKRANHDPKKGEIWGNPYPIPNPTIADCCVDSCHSSFNFKFSISSYYVSESSLYLAQAPVTQDYFYSINANTTSRNLKFRQFDEACRRRRPTTPFVLQSTNPNCADKGWRGHLRTSTFLFLTLVRLVRFPNSLRRDPD